MLHQPYQPDEPQQPPRKPPANHRRPYVLLLAGVALISFAAQGGTAGSSTGPAEAAATGTVLATFTGNGMQATARFTVPRSGNWELKWSYSCASLGSRGNFIVDEDNDSDLNGVAVDELGTGSSGIARVYGDAGRHYLDVNSECDWSMSAVSRP